MNNLTESKEKLIGDINQYEADVASLKEKITDVKVPYRMHLYRKLRKMQDNLEKVRSRIASLDKYVLTLDTLMPHAI